jgi:histidyl-tRNA synthetase
MEELGLFPENATQSTQLILLSFDNECITHASQLANKFRTAGISTEVYPTAAKMKKQMKYANERGIPYVIVIGSNEMESGTYKLKNMGSGEQEEVGVDGVIEKLS